MAEWVMASAALAGVGASVTSGIMNYNQQESALKAQKKAQAEAKATQEEADQQAERERLEALAQNTAAIDYGDVWGIDSNVYKDAATKFSAGTGSFNTEEEEENPFYARGLV